jgi:hypothetical protein
MSTPLVEKFVALSASDLIDGNSVGQLDHLKNAVVAFSSEQLIPMLAQKFNMQFNPEQRQAVEALSTGVTIYVYDWIMKQPQNTTEIVKKALISQGLVYGYHKFK